MPTFAEVIDAPAQISSPFVAENQRYLMIIEDMQGASIGIPLHSPPMLRRVPKSAFSPVPAIYLVEGNIQCISALITVSESEPPLFLLNLDQLLQQGEGASRDLPEGAPKSAHQIAETRRLQS
jgi:chemotaxis signal transduction protein